jgi:hypothetical protein
MSRAAWDTQELHIHLHFHSIRVALVAQNCRSGRRGKEIRWRWIRKDGSVRRMFGLAWLGGSRIIRAVVGWRFGAGEEWDWRKEWREVGEVAMYERGSCGSLGVLERA